MRLFIFIFFPRLPFTTLLSAKDELASERLLKYLVNFISNGDPNQGYSVENNANWEPATQPNYEYFDINGNEASPKMKYDDEMKVRAEFWSHIFDEIHSKFNYLSGTPPKTMEELSIFAPKKSKEDL